MKILLLSILISCNVILVGSQGTREYTKNTCNRSYWGRYLTNDKDRAEHAVECRFSRLELYDREVKRYIASIAYDPSKCSIEFLSVAKDFQKQGIGSDLTKRAIKDMRVNYGCKEVSLHSAPSAELFWQKTGAIKAGNVYVFPASRDLY